MERASANILSRIVDTARAGTRSAGTAGSVQLETLGGVGPTGVAANAGRRGAAAGGGGAGVDGCGASAPAALGSTSAVWCSAATAASVDDGPVTGPAADPSTGVEGCRCWAATAASAVDGAGAMPRSVGRHVVGCRCTGGPIKL